MRLVRGKPVWFGVELCGSVRTIVLSSWLLVVGLEVPRERTSPFPVLYRSFHLCILALWRLFKIFYERSDFQTSFAS